MANLVIGCGLSLKWYSLVRVFGAPWLLSGLVTRSLPVVRCSLNGDLTGRALIRLLFLAGYFPKQTSKLTLRRIVCTILELESPLEYSSTTCS
jgi:hypothetical protein